MVFAYFAFSRLLVGELGGFSSAPPPPLPLPAPRARTPAPTVDGADQVPVKWRDGWKDPGR